MAVTVRAARADEAAALVPLYEWLFARPGVTPDGWDAAGELEALLDAAKAWGRDQGCTHLELDSAMGRTDAHRFYEREGASPASASFGWRL